MINKKWPVTGNPYVAHGKAYFDLSSA